MKGVVCTLLVLFVSSCELHEQEALVSRESDEQVFTLSNVEEMFVAIINDDYFKLKLLLDEQEDLVNTPNGQGQLLIVEAIRAENRFLAHLLVLRGANISLRDNSNLSAIDLVSRLDDHLKEEWESILDGQDFEQEYLNELSLTLASETSQRSEENSIKRLDLYLVLGADVNARKGRNTLLMIVASKGLENMVRYLCERDDLNINEKVGRYTALGLVKALTRRNPELKKISDILLEYGAR